jgi:tetratricopeptide (TPR) repeat protein
MFAASERARTALLPLAELLFADYVNFGRLAVHFTLEKGTLDRYLGRAELTLEYLIALSELADLRFSEESRFPFVSNSASWSDGAPSAGYTGTSADPTPGDVAYTLFAGWVADGKGAYPAVRPLRAALKHLNDQGFDAAVRLLIDLQNNGFIPGQTILEEILQIFAHGRGATASDRELAQRLVPGIDDLITPRDWIGVDLCLDWLPADAWYRPESSELIELALAEVADLRRAETLDEWLSRNASVCTTVWAVKYLLESPFEPSPSLGMRTVLSQLEEIACDSFAFLGSLRSAPIASGGAAIGVIEKAMLAIAAPAIKARIERQRALRPDCLAGVELEPLASLPLSWQYISWRNINSLAAYIPDDGEVALDVERIAYPETIGTEIVCDDWRVTMGMIESPDHEAAIEVFAGSLERYPWSSRLRHELAIRLDETGSHDKARETMIEALTLSPDDPELWQSLAVVLRNCGADEEAMLTHGIEQVMLERAT